MVHNRPRVCYVISTVMTAKAFLIDQLTAIAASYDVIVVANESNPDSLREIGLNVPVHHIAIARQPSLMKDLKAVAELYRFFRKNKFQLVHSVTPKAGLITAISSLMARVPLVIHTFTGQVWSTRTGITRYILKSMDGLIARRATHILVDSETQRDFIADEGVAPLEKMRVLANGSISGVDVDKFRPDPALRAEIRKNLGIPTQDPVILYLGRLNLDKGVLDLAEAFALLSQMNTNLNLLLVGPDEGNLSAQIKLAQPDHLTESRVHFVDYTEQPEAYMASADIFCLPSYREGFGTVIIEAAATGLPAVASNIYGIRDAVQDGETGLLFEAHDVEGLTRCLSTLITDPCTRKSMGTCARDRALRSFGKELLTSELISFYQDIFEVSKCADT